MLLTEKHKSILIGIIKSNFTNPVEIWAFGSRVKGTGHELSDLDLVIKTKDNTPVAASVFSPFIEQLKNSTLPFLIDVHDWSALPEQFKAEIEKDHLLLFDTDNSKQS